MNTDQPVTTYFGTKHTKVSYKNSYSRYDKDLAAKFRNFSTLAGQTERCPCPKLPTSVPPEFATRAPLQVIL